MRILLIVSLLIGTTFAKSYKEFASEVKYETSYEVAIKKAQKEKKDIMLLLITNYCPWCQKLEKRVLSKKAINKQVHKKYIPLIINKDENNFPKKFDSSFVPVVYFVDYKTENIKHEVMGYNNRSDLISIINE